MKSALLLITIVVLFSCSEDGVRDESTAILTACRRCDMNVPQMRWLSVKIQEAQNDVTKNGNFYAVPTSEGIVIVHQPVIMSCLACLRYDCHGNTPALSNDVVVNELMPGINSGNLIYEMRY